MSVAKKILQFHNKFRRLSPASLETKLLGLRSTSRNHDGGWIPEITETGVLIDLSRCEFVDLGALCQLVLLIESAVASGVHIQFAMPLRQLRKSESHYLRSTPSNANSLRRAVDRRNKLYEFLETIGLRKALSHSHMLKYRGRITELENFDNSFASEGESATFTREICADEIDEELESARRTFGRIMPLTWVAHSDRALMDAVESLLGKILDTSGTSHGSRGILPLDAQTLSNVVAEEIAQNVADHSGRTWGLMCAWSVSGEFWEKLGTQGRIEKFAEQFLKPEAEYTSWLSEHRGPFIELFFGDSGAGISKTLGTEYTKQGKPLSHLGDYSEEEQTILWAFDRWSTSNRRRIEMQSYGSDIQRGTRGLYRVERVARSYAGFIGIRSGGSFCGFDYGAAEGARPVKAPKQGLGYFPGTLLRIKMSAEANTLATRVYAVRKGIPPRFQHDSILIEESGVSGHSKRKLISAFAAKPRDVPYCFVAFAEFSQGIRAPLRDVVARAIRDLAEIRHPGLLVLCGIPGGWSLISGQIESFRSEIDSTANASLVGNVAITHTVYDPILVVDELLSSWDWAGCDSATHHLLTELLRRENGALTQQECQAALRRFPHSGQILRRLRADTDLITFDIDGSISTVFTFLGFSKYIGELIHRNVEAQLANINPTSYFVTPSLANSKIWINRDLAFRFPVSNRAMGAAAGMRLGFEKVLDSSYPIHVLAESKRVEPIARELVRWIGAKSHSVMQGEAEVGRLGGDQQIPSEHSIVIVSEIVRTQQSAERCVRESLRCAARPKCVIQLLSMGARSNAIEVWGVQLPVFSLCEYDLGRADTIDESDEPIYLNPINFDAEPPSVYETRDSVSLRRLMDETDCFLSGHLESDEIGRHFTLFLSPMRLLASRTLRECFRLQVKEWLDLTRFTASFLDVWVPEDHASHEQSLQAMIKDLQGLPTIRTKLIPRKAAFGEWRISPAEYGPSVGDHVLIMDWGTVTATTLKGLAHAAAARGALHVLVFVAVSQLPLHERDFLMSINSILVPAVKRKPEERGQLLLCFPAEEVVTESRETLVWQEVAVTFRFATSFPGAPFRPEDCPVCDQMKRVAAIEYPTNALQQIARRIIARHAAIRIGSAFPPDHMNRTVQQQRGFAPIEILEFKLLLQDALVSTRKRAAVQELLRDAFESICNRARGFSKALAIVHLLSREIHWLRTPPLHYRSLRQLLARVCHFLLASSDVDEQSKIECIVVLRSASKYHFAMHAHEIFTLSRGFSSCTELVAHSLFTMTLLSDEPLSVYAKPLIARTKEILDGIAARTCSASEEVEEVIRLTHRRITLHLQRLESTSKTLAENWSRLRSAYDLYFDHNSKHCSLQHSMRLMLPGPWRTMVARHISDLEMNPGLPAPPQIRKYVQNLAVHWTQISTFMKEQIEPTLPAFRTVLQSLAESGHIGIDAARFFERYSCSEYHFAESPFARTADALATERFGDISGASWKQFCVEATELRDHLFSRAAGTTHRGSASLVNLLFSAPADLASCLRHWLSEEVMRDLCPKIRSVRLGSLPDRLPVFLPAQLLSELIEELLTNAGKHISVERDLELTVNVSVEKQWVHLSFRNSTSRGSENVGFTPASELISGHGLRRLRQLLEPFNAKLSFSKSTDDSTGGDVFVVTVQIEKAVQ